MNNVEDKWGNCKHSIRREGINEGDELNKR